jgi:hypothetical protein
LTTSKKILLVTVITFIAIQLFRPAFKKNTNIPDTDISKISIVTDSVLYILKKACYDCHSINTTYPWYMNIQPAGWIMSWHIKKGKKELNFSDFGSYSPRRQVSKLDGIANSIKDDIMPLKSYKILHKSAQLSTDEKSLLINWAQHSSGKLLIEQ